MSFEYAFSLVPLCPLRLITALANAATPNNNIIWDKAALFNAFQNLSKTKIMIKFLNSTKKYLNCAASKPRNSKYICAPHFLFQKVS